VKHPLSNWIFGVVALLAIPSGLCAASIEGRVMNGTLNRPVANAKVLLLSPQPQVGMKLLDSVTAGADGRFVLSMSDLDPDKFYLLQVNAGDVPYHFPVRFDSQGSAKVDATVYDSTESDAALRVGLLRILVQANGDKVQVQQEYEVQNPSSPPRAYADANGTFRFRLPAQAPQPSVAVAGLMNMQIPQTTTPGKTAGEYVLHYPFKPGATKVTVQYEADYTSAGFALDAQVPYPVVRAELYVMPANLAVESPVFKPAGRDTSKDIQTFEAETLPRDAALTASLSGEAAPGTQPQGEQAEGGVKVVPNSMSKLGVPLLGCFLLVLLWALGIRATKDWQLWKATGPSSPAGKQFEAKAEELLNSLADLDELFEAGKVEKKQYWKERLELKAKLMAILKKGPPALRESYATRRVPR
jgi:hypothetical protein